MEEGGKTWGMVIELPDGAGAGMLGAVGVMAFSILSSRSALSARRKSVRAVNLSEVNLPSLKSATATINFCFTSSSSI